MIAFKKTKTRTLRKRPVVRAFLLPLACYEGITGRHNRKAFRKLMSKGRHNSTTPVISPSDTLFFPLSSFGPHSLPRLNPLYNRVFFYILVQETLLHCIFILASQSNWTRAERLSQGACNSQITFALHARFGSGHKTLGHVTFSCVTSD